MLMGTRTLMDTIAAQRKRLPGLIDASFCTRSSTFEATVHCFPVLAKEASTAIRTMQSE
jgi:hypothetical protein